MPLADGASPLDPYQDEVCQFAVLLASSEARVLAHDSIKGLFCSRNMNI